MLNFLHDVNRSIASGFAGLREGRAPAAQLPGVVNNQTAHERSELSAAANGTAQAEDTERAERRVVAMLRSGVADESKRQADAREADMAAAEDRARGLLAETAAARPVASETAALLQQREALNNERASLQERYVTADGRVRALAGAVAKALD